MKYLNRAVDSMTAWRYHLEAISHVSLIILALSLFGLPFSWLSFTIAWLTYSIVGKIQWYVRHNEFHPKDFLFDTGKNAAPAVFLVARDYGILWGFLASAILTAFYTYLAVELKWSSP
jgi:hypothetical protein